MTLYYRPIVQSDASRPPAALALAGGRLWFDRVEVLSRSAAPREIAASELPKEAHLRLTAPRPAILGFDWSGPVLMGVLNVTPDSFSDGGQFESVEAALGQGLAMAAAGAGIIDIGGESTRPEADFVDAATEISRVVPVITALRAAGLTVPISVDTRKAAVARAAIVAGASVFNDVTALSYDPMSMELAFQTGVAVCLMHSPRDLATMQVDPRYDDVVLDIYDHLAARIAACVAAGISPGRIVVDVGIGFGKTLEHNLALLRGIALFHGLGCPILLGVSRKRFIGSIGGAQDASRRMPGSIAAALAGLQQGVQIFRVHDMAETAQAFAVWRSVGL